MKKYLLVIFISIGLLGATITGDWNSTPKTGVPSLYKKIYKDSLKITRADTITYPSIVISATDLHGLYISTDDDSVVIQYRQNFTPYWTGDWKTLDSLPSEKWYSLFLVGYSDYLQIRLIGLGVDSTIVKLGIIVGKIE